MTPRAAILELINRRGPEKSICPSEAARLVDHENWRKQMPAVRAATITLFDESKIVVTRKGEPVDPRTSRGPIRIRVAGDA